MSGQTPQRSSFSDLQLKDAPIHTFTLAVVVVLGLAAPSAIIATNNRVSLHTPAVILAACLMAYSATRLGATLSRAELQLTALFFWMFVYLSLGLAPLAQLATGLSQPIISPNIDTAFAISQLIVLLGCLSFDVGRTLPILRPAEIQRPAQQISKRYIVGLVLFSIPMSCLYIASIGISAFFESRDSLSDQAARGTAADQSGQAASAVISAFGTVPILVLLVICIRLIRVRDHRFGTLTVYLLFGVSAAINAVVNNPISNARYWFVSVLVALLFASFNFSRKALAGLCVAIIVSAVYLFPYADYFRRDSDTRQLLTSNSTLETLATKDYDQMVMIANGVSAVQEAGHSNGRQLLGAVGFWIPRAVWEDKPEDTGVLIGEAMLAENVNLSSPLWIESWYDWSYVGVGITFVLLGILSRRVDSLDTSPTHIITASRIFVPLLAAYQLIILRGSLLQAMGRLSTIALLALIAWLLANSDTDEAAVL